VGEVSDVRTSAVDKVANGRMLTCIITVVNEWKCAHYCKEGANR
jgi:hypothetical protein